MSTRSQGFVDDHAVTSLTMLRKALWTALYGVMGALSTLAARRFASRVWRIATGEEPPTKK
jgi:hypothetical protein